MPSRIKNVRTAVKNAIATAKASDSYVRNDFELLEEHYHDHDELSRLKGIRIILIGLMGSVQKIARAPISQREIMIAVTIQKKLTTPNALSESDELTQLLEEIEQSCETVSHQKYSFIRTEPSKDETGLPNSYRMAADMGLFQATFLAVYQYVT